MLSSLANRDNLDAFLDLMSLPLLTWFRRGGVPPSADHEQRGPRGIATDQWGQAEVTELHPAGYKVITWVSAVESPKTKAQTAKSPARAGR